MSWNSFVKSSNHLGDVMDKQETRRKCKACGILTRYFRRLTVYDLKKYGIADSGGPRGIGVICKDCLAAGGIGSNSGALSEKDREYKAALKESIRRGFRGATGTGI